MSKITCNAVYSRPGYLWNTSLKYYSCRKIGKAMEGNGHGLFYNIPSLPRIAIRGCIQKFPDWPPGARTTNGTGLCH
jgi:hypothetical protein